MEHPGAIRLLELKNDGLLGSRPENVREEDRVEPSPAPTAPSGARTTASPCSGVRLEIVNFPLLKASLTPLDSSLLNNAARLTALSNSWVLNSTRLSQSVGMTSW